MTAHVTPSSLWLACIGLLLGMAVLELAPPREQATPVVSIARVPRSIAATRPQVRAQDYARIALGRPLFSVHRRPLADAARPASAGTAVVPRLSGIIIAANTRRALFDTDGKLLAGGVGEHVGPYAILAITPRQVSVIGPLGLQTLTPGFSTAAKAITPSLGPSILDRLRNQQLRQPALPSSAALSRLLLEQQTRSPQ